MFNRTGIGHLISISGLHVTVFASIAGGLALALARRSVALTTRIPARRVAAGCRHRVRARLRVARGCAGPGGSNAADARCRRGRHHRRASGQRRRRLAVGARRRADRGIRGPGSRRDSGCRSALSASCSTPASGRLTSAPPASFVRAHAESAASGRTHAGCRHRCARPGHARALPAGLARVAARQRARHSDRHVCGRAAGAHRDRAADRCVVDGRARRVRGADDSARMARRVAGRGMAAACAGGLGGCRRARRRPPARGAARRAGTRPRRDRVAAALRRSPGAAGAGHVPHDGARRGTGTRSGRRDASATRFSTIPVRATPRTPMRAAGSSHPTFAQPASSACPR